MYPNSLRPALQIPRASRCAALSLLLLVGACATTSYTEAELASVGNPALVTKLKRGQMLTLNEVIALDHRPGGEQLVVRHVQKTGLNYTVSPSDVARLRQAGVGEPAIKALQRQSERFLSGQDDSFSFGTAF